MLSGEWLVPAGESPRFVLTEFEEVLIRQPSFRSQSHDELISQIPFQVGRERGPLHTLNISAPLRTKLSAYGDLESRYRNLSIA